MSGRSKVWDTDMVILREYVRVQDFKYADGFPIRPTQLEHAQRGYTPSDTKSDYRQIAKGKKDLCLPVLVLVVKSNKSWMRRSNPTSSREFCRMTSSRIPPLDLIRPSHLEIRHQNIPIERQYPQAGGCRFDPILPRLCPLKGSQKAMRQTECSLTSNRTVTDSIDGYHTT